MKNKLKVELLLNAMEKLVDQEKNNMWCDRQLGVEEWHKKHKKKNNEGKGFYSHHPDNENTCPAYCGSTAVNRYAAKEDRLSGVSQAA
jgi:hypothetical protein